MAIKVLKGPSTFTTTCKECGATLQFERSDLQHGYRCFGAYDEWPVEYIECPVCKEEIEVYSDGELCKGIKVVRSEEHTKKKGKGK